MEKYEILNIIYSAINETSPYAKELLSTYCGERGKSASFVDLGINSIDYAEISSIVMDKLNITHTLDIFTSTNCISEVAQIFYDLLSVETHVAEATLYSSTHAYNLKI